VTTETKDSKVRDHVKDLKTELQLLNERFESNMELIKSLQGSEEKKKVSLTSPEKDEGKSSNHSSPAIKLQNNASGSQFPSKQTEQSKERYQNMKK